MLARPASGSGQRHGQHITLPTKAGQAPPSSTGSAQPALSLACMQAGRQALPLGELLVERGAPSKLGWRRPWAQAGAGTCTESATDCTGFGSQGSPARVGAGCAQQARSQPSFEPRRPPRRGGFWRCRDAAAQGFVVLGIVLWRSLQLPDQGLPWWLQRCPHAAEDACRVGGCSARQLAPVCCLLSPARPSTRPEKHPLHLMMAATFSSSQPPCM